MPHMPHDAFLWPEEYGPTPQMPWSDQGFLPWLQGGQAPYKGMAHRMMTGTEENPWGDPLPPPPQQMSAPPPFDPSMVNPGLSFPQGLPDPGLAQEAGPYGPIGPAGVGETAMAQEPPLRPGSTFPLSPMGFGEPPPAPGNSFQPQGGLAGTGGLSPAPSPMQQWMTDYNQQTDDYVAAQQEQAKAAMWIQMGQSLLANIGDPAMGLAGMGQAAAQYGTNKPAMEQYKQGREGERMDLLYKMERIRKSQAPREFRPPAEKDISLGDDTIATKIGPNRYMYNGEEYTQAGLNEIMMASEARALVKKYNWKQRIAGLEREQAIDTAMQNLGVDRQMAELMYDLNEGPGGTGAQLPVPDPAEAGQAYKDEAFLDAQRAAWENDPELGPIIEHMTPEEFEEFVKEAEEYGQ